MAARALRSNDRTRLHTPHLSSPLRAGGTLLPLLTQPLTADPYPTRTARSLPPEGGRTGGGWLTLSSCSDGRDFQRRPTSSSLAPASPADRIPTLSRKDAGRRDRGWESSDSLPP